MVAQLTAQIKVDQAVIDNARTQLDYTRITSPINGRTGIRLVDPGNIVHASDTTGIVVVTQVQPISVVFTLPEEVLPQSARRSSAVNTTVTALSRDGKTKLDEGTLSLIDNQIDQATGTVKLKATFTTRTIRFGPASSSMRACWCAQLHDAVTVPNEAVQPGPNGPLSMSSRRTRRSRSRPVQVGRRRQRRQTRGLSGLDAGERVVTQQPVPPRAGSRAVQRAHEHFRAVRPPPDRDLAVDGRASCSSGLVVYPLLPVAPLPQVDFPTIQVSAQLPGASPGDHGLLGGAAARVPVRADPRICRR